MKFASKTLYVGEGFIDSQLLWLIPILHGYCKKKKINCLFFDKKISDKVLNNKIITSILKQYKIFYLNSLPLIYSNKYFFLLTFGFIVIFKSLLNAFLLKREKIICKDWFKSQLRHAVWDTSILKSKDGQTTPDFIKLFISYIQCYRKIILSNYLIKKLKIKDFFIAHTVYASRAFLANLRKFNTNIFCHSGFTIYKQSANKDSSWCFIDAKQLKKIKKKITQRDIEAYWKRRSLGKGNYEDSRIAARIKNISERNYKNVVFLHIFRDSPFADIDRNRIFEDYIIWVKKTLQIVKNSKEEWIFRYHPSYKKWGEDQKIAVKQILKDTFNNAVPKNIKFESNLNSNNFVYNSAKRIVTFNGTSHLEAVANGIKPIIISETMLSFLNKKLVIKPNSVDQYCNMLLTKSSDDIFKIKKKKDINYAKKLIFLRENVLKFENDIGGLHIFQNDSKQRKLIDFRNTEKNLASIKKFLLRNGELLVDKIKITTSSNYIDND